MTKELENELRNMPTTALIDEVLHHVPAHHKVAREEILNRMHAWECDSVVELLELEAA